MKIKIIKENFDKAMKEAEVQEDATLSESGGERATMKMRQLHQGLKELGFKVSPISPGADRSSTDDYMQNFTVEWPRTKDGIVAYPAGRTEDWDELGTINSVLRIGALHYHQDPNMNAGKAFPLNFNTLTKLEDEGKK